MNTRNLKKQAIVGFATVVFFASCAVLPPMGSDKSSQKNGQDELYKEVMSLEMYKDVKARIDTNSEEIKKLERQLEIATRALGGEKRAKQVKDGGQPRKFQKQADIDVFIGTENAIQERLNNTQHLKDSVATDYKAFMDRNLKVGEKAKQLTK